MFKSFVSFVSGIISKVSTNFTIKELIFMGFIIILI